MESQLLPQAPARPPRRLGVFFIKTVLALVLVVVGFVLGVYSGNLSESRTPVHTVTQQQYQGEDAGEVPANRQRTSAAAYDGGVALHFIEKGSQCGDLPRYSCRGALYEVANGQMKQVASNVEGGALMYYEPGVRALLRSGWGDGGCRDTKFYVYSFASASSTLTFDKSNCDEATYDEYQKSISDYLAQFSL